MRPATLCLVAILSVAGPAAGAFAQASPAPAPSSPPAAAATADKVVDLTGSWSGTSKSIVSGMPAHHPVTMPAVIVDGHRLTEVSVKVRIDGQEDRRFWGSIASAAAVEKLIGVIAPDGKHLRMVAQGGGIVEGTLLDDNRIELVYTESRPGVSVAGTNVLTRETAKK